MKILLIHSDFLEFEPKTKAIKSAEEWKRGLERVEECLVVFTAVEKSDEKNPQQAVENLIKEVKDVALQVNAEKIVLYPYAHLSKELASPDIALSILKGAEQKLKEEKYKVIRAPFGWYKAFTVKCKGHPLSELSREIGVEDVSEALKKEKEELKSEFFIFEPNGKHHKIHLKDNKVEGFDFSKHEKLQKFVNYELMKSRIVDIEPPHIKLMRKLELVDYEEGSDPGNFRW
ncbi:threonine--tRNA ligase, partial [Candidatus Woesearchaeota archaeon]|nr:threonine--tRNA ligase [Candidatus Woesearchaeota archaeon]